MNNSTYTYDSKSLIRDGKRWFPVMGEIHYSRYPEQYWKEALLKMKAGGVDIISSYVIWIHHEEIENEWDWSGCKDLRKFVETIKECGLTMILRVGPWSHAEVRNGGFPDWLLAKCPKYRSNDEAYFAEVEIWYKKIFEQVKGLLLKDGGPIIGVQVENEFGHCGGLCGDEGVAHMKRLEKMLRDIGYDVPLYTATGWGGAVTADLLPVMGGYCEAPWDPRITEIEPSGNFVFTYERNDHAIGCDFGLGEGITFDMTKVPYLTAELGGGLQVTYKRRPVAQPRDIGGMSISKIGSGCSLLGYYMYHGGTNPEGKLTTLEESIKSGSLNDLPVKNYDFRAPLGEYGQPNGTFREVKRLAMFVHDYGEELAEMETDIPEANPIHPTDSEHLRYSWKYNKETDKGYLFVTNFQRRQKMQDQKATLKLPECLCGNGVNEISVEAKDGDFYFVPLAKGVVPNAKEMPLCKISAEGKVKEVLYPVADSCDVDSKVGEDKIVLSRSDSLNAAKLTSACGCRNVLAVSDGIFYENGQGGYFLETRGAPSFKSYPAVKGEGFDSAACECGFTRYKYNGDLPAVPKVSYETVAATEEKLTVKVVVEQWDNTGVLSDVFLKLNYTGNCARIYENGKLIDDNIYIGPDYSWEIGLKRYGCSRHEFVVEIDALKKDQPIFLEKWPVLEKENTVELLEVSAENCYRFPVAL